VTEAALAGLGAALALGVVLWLVSLWLENASIVDIFWGPLFVLIGGTTYWLGGGSGPRRQLVLVLVAIWALRLASHLARRNFGHGEDPRYRDMRSRNGGAFWLLSLPYVFLLQPLLAWIIAAPVLAVMQHEGPPHLDFADAAATLIFALGLAIETIADRQLATFRSDARNRERVLDRGLFRYSRHPNYFGEFVLWWGLGVFGLAAGSVYSLVGPALLSVLLLRVSGVTLLERTIENRRPDYSKYKATTNAFFPGPPRRLS
jgi:steroid 5-alpha reductase family enzyme